MRLTDKDDTDNIMYADDRLTDTLNWFGGQGWESYAVIKEENKIFFILKYKVENQVERMTFTK